MVSQKKYRPLEHLSKRQRQETPLPFAKALIGLVRALCGPGGVNVLWCRSDSNYFRILPPECIWTKERDARSYAGSSPVICHPPCGPWGKYKARCFQEAMDGEISIKLVHRYGGIVEQPLGSKLFETCGRGGLIVRVRQGEFGHLAQKDSLLYCVGL